MATPLINGRAFDFAQIVVNVLGVPLASVSAISYTEEQEKVNNFGAGSNPVSRGHGTKNASGSMTISMNDVEAIRDAVEGGSLLSVPSFDVVVTYVNLQKTVTHTLKNVEFLNDGVEATSGDTDLQRSFDVVMSHIVWH